MPHRFVHLIANRNLRSFDGRLAGLVEREVPPLTAESSHNHRMLGQEILLEFDLRLIVDPEHSKVQIQHILLGHVRPCRGCILSDNHAHIVRQALTGSGLGARTLGTCEVEKQHTG